MNKKESMKNDLRTFPMCEVQYQKVDGEMRTALATLNPDTIPDVSDESKTAKSEPDHVIRYWDIHSGGWRTFIVDRVVSFTPIPIYGEG